MLMFCLWLQLFLNLRNFSDIFCKWLQASFQKQLYLDSLLKGTWGQNFTPVFMACFFKSYAERALHKVLRHFGQTSWSYKVSKFWIPRKWRYPVNVENIPLLVLFPFFVSFIKKKPPTKFESVLEHFSRAYEVVKFWMIKL